LLCLIAQISRYTIFVAEIVKTNGPMSLAVEILENLLIELVHVFDYFNVHCIIIVLLKSRVEIKSVDELDLLERSIVYSFFLIDCLLDISYHLFSAVVSAFKNLFLFY